MPDRNDRPQHESSWRGAFHGAYLESYVGSESRRRIRWTGYVAAGVAGIFVVLMAINLISPEDPRPPVPTVPALQFSTVPAETVTPTTQL